MYEGVHAHPEGASTVARLAATAADYGFDGLIVRNHGDAPADYDAARIQEIYGIDIVEGVEVRADDPAQASGHLGTLRESTTLVLVHGGTSAMNRFAANQAQVDVLAHPASGDADPDHVLVQSAAANGVRIEFDFGPVLRQTGGGRVQAIAELRKLRELVLDADAPFVVSARPASHLEIRAPRELIAVGAAIGFEEAEIEAGLTEWRRLTERNRDRLADESVAPGVTRGEYAEDES